MLRPSWPEVLDLGIERVADTERWLLVDRIGGHELAKGTLPYCERKRTSLLLTRHGEGHLNVPFPTLGGKQFWADVFVHAGWRIQGNVLGGGEMHRLIDPENRRYAWGSYAECRTAFHRTWFATGMRARSAHAVVFVHGLIRSRVSLERMAASFGESGYEVVDVGYPSTRRPIEDHARQLSALLDQLSTDIERLSFVTHSMGGIIVRAMLAIESGSWRDRIDLDRMLMLFPPNRGAASAQQWQDNQIAQLIYGPPLAELSSREDVTKMPAPPCPFAVIAGSRDTRVRPDEAWLPGAEAFAVLDVGHTFGMYRSRVIATALRYIDTGILEA